MAADQTLEALEARFADLECRILGESAVGEHGRTEGETVADLLADASASIRAATSGRDSISSVASRVGELDRYLDPTFEDSLDASALAEVALSAGPSLQACLERLERLVELSPVLDSKAMGDVAAHGGHIESLLSAALERREMSEECCARVYALVDEYNAVVVNVTKTLVQWDDAVTQLELERRPKKIVE